MNRVLEARDDAIRGAAERAATVRARAEGERDRTEALLAEARRDAARARQQAREQGAVLIAEARADAQRERDALLIAGQERIAAERQAAEAELRMSVSELASELAHRIVGEPVAACAERSN
jgi:F-type H+-transporting ATPase subunit b